MVSHGGFHPAVVEPVNDVGVEQFAKDTGDPHELWPVLAGWLVDSRTGRSILDGSREY